MSEGNGSTPKESKREPLVAPRVKQAGYLYTHHDICFPQGTTLEDIKNPKYWSFVAVLLKQYDRIVATEESGAFSADLIVTACDRTWAVVEVMNFKQLREATAEESQPKAPTLEEYRVAYRGPHHKWRVERVSDNHILFKEGQTKIEADTWLTQHRNTLAKTVA